MKFNWNTFVNFHGYFIMPIVGVFFMYSIGAAILKGEWMLLLWGAGSLALSVLVLVVGGLMS